MKRDRSNQMCAISKIFLFLLTALSSSIIFAQYPIGHRTITFTDPSRNNRQIPAEIYYPAETAGNNTTVASGVFPTIVFGHGFVMPFSAYSYLHNAMVPEGYLVVFTTTEGGLFPDHQDYGLDLAFLVNAMKAEGENAASPFYQHVDTTSAVMGHSMGGGASFLACEDNASPTAMVTFAAAETNPSAIAAASQTTTPSLVFAASEDCITPPATNQVPMYESLASLCKVYINITGGGHCYFADYNFQCSLGEAGCQQNFTITREEQNDIVLDFTRPYLDYYLKKNPASWITFNDSLTASQRITSMIDCTITGSEAVPGRSELRVCPNPAEDVIILDGNLPPDENATIYISDLSGKILIIRSVNGKDVPCSFDISSLPAGFWILSVITGKTEHNTRFIKK